MGIDQFKPKKDNKYKEGEIVYAKECPSIPLVIRRYVHRVYYCKIVDDKEEDELVYYERELIQPLEKA
ncbi:hypothetical protein [Roseivirga sp. E12]|uniref:hypothetical protein n=1 Tax=Roseivirga sp. E12 TaxID=2819237 RepID=UPI001ABD4739|nr:hypothetical protein [Roseivirga sp. E12]MBO3697891.1 hypothetical protein [Roseivirga sp. E12]